SIVSRAKILSESDATAAESHLGEWRGAVRKKNETRCCRVPSRRNDAKDPSLTRRAVWWTHKGSNLGPLPCEGNALPLSYASGNGEKECRQSLRFTKCGPLVSSDSQARHSVFERSGHRFARRKNASKQR